MIRLKHTKCPNCGRGYDYYNVRIDTTDDTIVMTTQEKDQTLDTTETPDTVKSIACRHCGTPAEIA